MNRKYWRIECEEGITKISSLIVSNGQITDKAIKELMRFLFAKHILTDDEILSNLCKKDTLRYENLIHFDKSHKFNSQNKVRIIYSAQSSGISILISLIYENELTVSEREKLKL